MVNLRQLAAATGEHRREQTFHHAQPAFPITIVPLGALAHLHASEFARTLVATTR